MKKLLLTALFVLMCGKAMAVEPAKIVVVDMQKLVESSTAANEIKEKAKKEREAFQAEAEKADEQLNKEDAALAEQRSVLTKEAFNEKFNKFKEKAGKIQHDFQEKRAAQEQVIKQSLDQVNSVIFDIIDGLAKEDGFDIAIPAAQLLHAPQSLDITPKVLERLNQKLPKIDSSKLEPVKKSESAKDSGKKDSDKKKKK